jgi:hypothetical protein
VLLQRRFSDAAVPFQHHFSAELAHRFSTLAAPIQQHSFSVHSAVLFQHPFSSTLAEPTQHRSCSALAALLQRRFSALAWLLWRPSWMSGDTSCFKGIIL